jgi:hypothetical protein
VLMDAPIGGYIQEYASFLRTICADVDHTLFEIGNNCAFKKSNGKKIGSYFEQQFVKISANFEENC